MTSHRKATLSLGCLLLCAAATLCCAPAQAAALTPRNDAQVIELLPSTPLARTQERQLRRELAQRPQDPAPALRAARQYLDEAHRSGDPRFAGRALALIAPWGDSASVSDAVLMLRAQLQQYLHDFDGSASTLQQLLTRKASPFQSQAWLTLATVRRVQGRYAESDAACRPLLASGASQYGIACLAENDGLRGSFATARAAFRDLLARRNLAPADRAWLATSIAELEQRAGRPQAALAAYQLALRWGNDDYSRIAYADLLIDQRRPAQALQVLAPLARTDAVLLRRAIAGCRDNPRAAADDIAELRARIALANERPDAQWLHGREQALFALWVDHDVPRALRLARGNAQRQREPLDLLVLARAARASGDASALREARALTRDQGIVDRRAQALL